MGDKNSGLSEKLKKNLTAEQLSDLEEKLESADGEAIENTRLKSVRITTILSAVLGLFGGGSFYLGRIRAGILKVVFNVIVPVAVAVFFCGWLSSTLNTYSEQSGEVYINLYLLSNDTSEYDEKALTAISRTDFKTAFETISAVAKTVESSDNFNLSGLKSADSVKSVLDGLNLQEVKILENGKDISVKIGFSDSLPQLTLSNLNSFKEKFTAVYEKSDGIAKQADALIKVLEEEIKNETDETTKSEKTELKSALTTVKSNSETASNGVKNLLEPSDPKEKDKSLDKCVEKFESEIEFLNGLNGRLSAYLEKTEIADKVDEKLKFNENLSSAAAHLSAVKNKDKLNDILNEFTQAMANINSVYSEGVSAEKNYLSDSQVSLWVPAVFLMIDGVIVLCWWIGEVFNDREKCRKANYEILLKAIEK